MDGGAWWATVHGGRKESDMMKQLSMHTCTSMSINILEKISGKKNIHLFPIIQLCTIFDSTLLIVYLSFWTWPL